MSWVRRKWRYFLAWYPYEWPNCYACNLWHTRPGRQCWWLLPKAALCPCSEPSSCRSEVTPISGTLFPHRQRNHTVRWYGNGLGNFGFWSIALGSLLSIHLPCSFGWFLSRRWNPIAFKWPNKPCRRNQCLVSGLFRSRRNFSFLLLVWCWSLSKNHCTIPLELVRLCSLDRCPTALSIHSPVVSA